MSWQHLQSCFPLLSPSIYTATIQDVKFSTLFWCLCKVRPQSSRARELGIRSNTGASMEEHVKPYYKKKKMDSSCGHSHNWSGKQRPKTCTQSAKSCIMAFTVLVITQSLHTRKSIFVDMSNTSRNHIGKANFLKNS